MHSRVPRRVTQSVVAVVIAAGLVLVGRLSVGLGSEGTPAYRDGYAQGQDIGYRAGLQAGVDEGRREGRALQEGDTVPAGSRQPVQEAFTSGYAAGANDVFSGYDGGWALDVPYVITLARGTTAIAYRISTRIPMESGEDYFLCPDRRSMCQQSR